MTRYLAEMIFQFMFVLFIVMIGATGLAKIVWWIVSRRAQK